MYGRTLYISMFYTFKFPLFIPHTTDKHEHVIERSKCVSFCLDYTLSRGTASK